MDDRMYRSYLLRVWRSGGAEPRWAVALEDVRTGERRGFASLAEALGHLEAQLPAGEEDTAPRTPRPSAPGTQL